MRHRQPHDHGQQTADDQAREKSEWEALMHFLFLDDSEEEEEEEEDKRTDEQRIRDQLWAKRLAATVRAECRRTMSLGSSPAHSKIPQVWRQLCKMDQPEMLVWLAQLQAEAGPAVVPSQDELAAKSDEDLRLLVLQLDHQRSTAD